MPRLSMLHLLHPLVWVLALGLTATGAVAGTTTIGIGLDSDNNPATGCVLSTANGSVPGIDQVASTVVTTTVNGVTVTRLERQVCVGGVLGAPTIYDNGGWNVGLGNGTAGSAVVETSIPLSLLPAVGTMKAVVVADNGTGGQDATATFSIMVLPASGPAGPIVVPLTPWLVPALALMLFATTLWLRRRYPGQTGLLLVLVVFTVSGLVWAATVIRDGNVGDWNGIAPAVTDASGDAPVNADVVAVFYQQDGANLYVRVDADIRKDAPGNQAPQVNAGPNQTITLPAAATLNGSATDDGLPNPPAVLTYAWTKFSGPGTVAFGNAASASTAATFSVAGTYVLRLTVSDSALSGSATVTIIVNPPGATNQPPVVNAGPNQTITLPSGATLSGSASDDGLPNPPGLLTYAWTKSSGPGSVTFGNASSAGTSATFSQAGTYVLLLTVSDSALSGSATVSIIVNAPGGTNQPPAVNAGANQSITLPAPVTLTGTASDDGLPNPPGLLLTTWSLVSGPVSGVVFGNPGSPGTTATFAAPGTYVLQLSAYDGALTASSTVQITVVDGAPQFDPIADRSIELGDRLQVLLQARDGNGNDTLTYALTAAPAGASLNPAPLIDWVPTAAQLGTSTFTAKVTDSSGNSATVTFHVTVVHTNRAPQLGPQASLTIAVGTAFARTLTASDPDAGDVLTFALAAGPAGMTLNGASLSWSTSGRSAGDYFVTVRVTDAAGLLDQKSFTVTLIPAAPGPVAEDDSYSVKVSRVLTVSAPGVLANDVYAGANALSATRLTNPGVGTLTAFNGDGSFSYQAPATPPGDPLTVSKLWNASAGSDRFHELAADLNGDGYPDVISFDNNLPIRARSGLDGSQLWSADNTGATDCRLNSGAGSMDQRVLADINDGGHPTLVFTTLCDRNDPTGSTWEDSILAFDHLGKVKWVSPPLSKPHPDIRRGATPVPPGGFTPGGLAHGRGLSVARLSAGGPPVLLMRAEIPVNDGYTYYRDAANLDHYAGCRAVTGLAADENVACRATFIISGTDGSVLQTLVARNPDAIAHFGGPNSLSQMPPIAMDIDGDGRVDLVSGTEVWMQNAGGGFDFAWQLTTSVNDTAVADLDGDGKAEIIHIRSNGGDADLRGIFVYSYDGQLKRRIPLQAAWITPLTIADVDGDGRSDIVVGGDGTLFAFRDDGRPMWAYKVPQDVPTDPILAPFYTQPAQEFAVANAAPQVYDLDGDGVAEVVFAAHSRIIILNGRTGVRKIDPYWTFNDSYHDVSALMLIDVNNDGHVDIVQNAPFFFNCLNPGVAPACAGLVGPVALSGGGSNNWLPGPKAFPNVQYRSTAIDGNARVLHDTKVSRVFRVPEQQGVVRDPRLAQATRFTYSASDGTTSSAPATVFIDIVPDNQPPVFTSTPPKSLLQRFAPTPPGGLVTNYYDVTAFDPDPGDTITFSLKSAPFWVSMSGPAQIRFEPTCGSFGNPCPWGWTTVIVTATDSRGASTDQIFIVNLTTTAVTVPNVVGLLFEAAKNTLIAQDLQGVLWVETFDLHPVGTVLAQDAVAGAVVGRFDDIRLTVSKGPQPVSMPFVIGQQLAAANALLTGAGLRVNVSTTFSNTIPAGEVMAQSPVAGTLLLPATAPPVDLTVSAGGLLPAPIASIALEPGPGAALRLAGDELQYKAVAILTDGTSADVTLTAAWASSLTGVATINTAGLAKAIAVGATTISASLGGKTGQGTLNVASRVSGDNTPPTAEITSPADGGAVTGLTSIVGTASDANFLRYELAIALAGDENYTVIAEGTTAVTSGTLGTLDPTMLVNSLYTLRLTVFDRDENVSIATRTAQVRGSLKIGLFTLTFQDLNVAASGLPLTISRTYDSRDKAQGDFGIGWRLGQQTLRLRTNRVLGTGWVRNVAGPVVSLAPTSEHKVSITMPDGKIEEFDMIVSPTSNFGSLDFTNVTGFQPRPGTLGQLQALANDSLLILDGGSEVELVDDSTLDTYSPKLYRYTTVDGTQFEVSPGAGVTKITDRNGNVVTFGPAGILNSDGTGISFTRDAKDRITAITDPSGNTQIYAYDGNGDLVQFTNATGGVTKFAYDRSHNVLDYQGPDGNHGVRNEYDASGRLIATTDARGNKITFDHSPGASQEIVRNRLGYQLVVDYDATGRVLAETNALGGVTTFTYDSQDNRLTETDPLGRVATKTYDARNNVLTRKDFNGNTTTYTYNAFGQQLTSTDPEGRLTTNVYDGSGNLTQSNDPEGGTVQSTYSAAGNLTGSVDQLGLLTTYTYDGSGNKTSQTDPLGRTTTYTYDANNREVSNTDPTGKQVRTDYDALGRVTAKLDKLGNRTSATYSLVANGQRLASRTGPDTLVTAFEYDVAGNLTKTTYPDGTIESVSYDAENHPLTKTDRGGAVTQYEYDALGRETRKTLPDGAVTTRTYDGAGRLLHQTNERGNTITHAYAPNIETVTDALGNVTVHTFDSNARRSKITDALGRATTFAYDSAGNLTKDTAPDGSSAVTTFDAAKRKTAVTDRAGKTTQFAYDSGGQLISVTDAAGGVTRYVYDAAGNRIAQTDASGRTTNMSYDAAGHLLSRARPSARQENFGYDANGNQLIHTDFNGRTATMVYDSANRLVQKNLPGGVSVGYAYTPLGFRKQAGGDSNAYDQRGRMTNEVKASGETITYAYDLAGNKTSVVTSKGTTTYAYDALDRISTVVDGTGTTTYSYDAVGNLLATASPNGTTATYSYDTLNRLVKVTNAQLSGVVSSYTYTVGPAGNRMQAVEAGSAVAQRTIAYGYDSLYRLTSEVISEPGQPDQAISYSYDAVGNRTQMIRNGVVTDYTYDIDDRLVTEVSAGTTTVSTYDNNGNLVSRSVGAVTESYGYDAENRMLTAVTPSGFVTFTYDADGMRTSRTAGGVITNFLLDKNRKDAQVLVETAGGATVVYNHGHQLISQIRPGGVAYFYVTDGQLSTRQLTDAAGTVTDRYTFDAFGRMLASTGSTPNAYLYTGQQLDPNIGFYYLRARYYDPQRGRFVATDPEDGNTYDPMSLHRYLYANANPITIFDPSGRDGETLGSLLAVTSIANTVFGAVTAGFTNIALKGAPTGFNKSRTFLTEVVVGGFNGFLSGEAPVIGPLVAGLISVIKDLFVTHYIEKQDIMGNDVIYSVITNVFIGGVVGVGLGGTAEQAIFAGAGAQNVFRLIGAGIALLTGTSTSGLEDLVKKGVTGGLDTPFWCKKDYSPQYYRACK